MSSIEVIEIKPFYKLMDYVLTRPLMFGIENVKELQVFIEGYKVAMFDNDDDLSEFSDFNDFIQDKYEIEGTYGWAKLVGLHSASNQHSLEVFKNVLEEFKLKKAKQKRKKIKQ